MKKSTALIIILLTAVTLFAFVLGGRSVVSSTLEEIEDKIGDAGDKKDDIAAQLEEVNRQINRRQDELEEMTIQYAKLLREQELNTSELEKQEQELEELYESIAAMQSTIEEMEEEYRAAMELFFKRASIINRYSNYSSLKLFIESQSIFTYTDLSRLVENLLQWDVEEMDRLEIMQRDLEHKKEMVELTKLDVEAAIAEKEEIIRKLKNDQEVLESDMMASRSAIDRLEKMEDELEEESAKIAKELAKLQSEYDRILEEQRRAKEEEERRAREEEQRQQEEAAAAANDDGTGMLWPAPSATRISSRYGWRIHPITGKYKFHSGVDIAAPGGSNILAVLSGTVVTATYHNSYGYYIIIYHGDGLSTLYAHSSKLLVKKGDYVERGQVIALVGSTGSSTGNHLHFEVRVNGETRDPLDYLPHFFD